MKKLTLIQSIVIVVLATLILILFLNPYFCIILKTKITYFFPNRDYSLFVLPTKKNIPHKENSPNNYLEFNRLFFCINHIELIQSKKYTDKIAFYTPKKNKGIIILCENKPESMISMLRREINLVNLYNSYTTSKRIRTDNNYFDLLYEVINSTPYELSVFMDFDVYNQINYYLHRKKGYLLLDHETMHFVYNENFNGFIRLSKNNNYCWIWDKNEKYFYSISFTGYGLYEIEEFLSYVKIK